MFIQDKQFPGYTSLLMVLVNSYLHVLQFKLAYWLFNISPCLRLSGSDKCLKLVLLIIHSANIIKYQLGIWHPLNVKAEIYPPPIKKRIKQNITKKKKNPAKTHCFYNYVYTAFICHNFENRHSLYFICMLLPWRLGWVIVMDVNSLNLRTYFELWKVLCFNIHLYYFLSSQ